MTTNKNQKQLHEARKLFLHELTNQLKSIEEHLGHYVYEQNWQSAQEIYRIAHTLKGSAPIFGLVAIGKVADLLVKEFEWTQLDCRIRLAPEQFGMAHMLISQLKMEQSFSKEEMLQEEKQWNEEDQLVNKQAYRLLLIDDDDVLRTYLVKRLSQEGYLVEAAANVEEAKHLLWERTFDLIMLDLMMHPQSGYEIFDYVRNDLVLKWIPLVVLSGKKDSKDKIRCYRMGADHYVTKPFHFEELEACIYRLLTRTQHYEHMAFRDPLTGVNNRRYFDHQLQVELAQTRRKQEPISIAFIDIDYFKKINDIYGHHIGDLVLQGLGRIIQQNLRATDLLARYGGEEFVIAFPGTSAEQATMVLERIRDQLQQAPVVQIDGQDFHITFSAGVADWDKMMPNQKWLEQADQAMYEAKRQGRNQIVRVKLDMDEPENDLEANQKKCLLIADDDQMIRSIIRTKLAHLGVDIIEATDGEEALEAMRNKRSQLCILDGIMPKIDGFSLLKIIRQDQNLRKMRIMMLSARNTEKDIVQGLSLGADDYMSKPFSMLELELRVKRLLYVE
ncbi:GGDEF domain-containing response regulator [Brevibacillus laterosporus]|uniref:GGDEF domain-containing response regulator n=1 Tax=Brevibacillus laterosporus TaxID=1465 RepID=UPI0018CDED4F|nr:diguanylate cyclase [Brevibacillus laterosporus]MBG9799989.1 response regulator PleD [Brevibacillus laterosporus]MED1909344.1 diguanylate cyclase [Brevibacillus laterosporus]